MIVTAHICCCSAFFDLKDLKQNEQLVPLKLLVSPAKFTKEKSLSRFGISCNQFIKFPELLLYISFFLPL
jgi:hypothetical protein